MNLESDVTYSNTTNLDIHHIQYYVDFFMERREYVLFMYMIFKVLRLAK